MRGALGYGLILFSLCATLLAQQDRVSARIEDGRRQVLPGAAHPRALPENDEGAIEPSFEMQGLVLYLGQSGDQQQSLRRYLDELQNPSSSSFHKFLTPEQYAERFGLSAPDLNKIRAWLESYGFQVRYMSRSRTWIAFQGTADQVERAFAAQVHRYRDQGQIRYANTRTLSIPAGLDGIVTGIGGLDNFPTESDIRYVPNYNNSDGSHRLAPGDLRHRFALPGRDRRNGTDHCHRGREPLESFRRRCVPRSVQSAGERPANAASARLSGPGHELGGDRSSARRGMEWRGGPQCEHSVRLYI